MDSVELWFIICLAVTFSIPVIALTMLAIFNNTKDKGE